MLAGVLLLAAALRFAGLDWGLRHFPHVDEAVYVENVVHMLDAGDLDHRYYHYPGLFYYLLALVLAPLGPERWHGTDAYLAARAFVASVGVLNVWLLYRVGTRVGGRACGLSAALLLAVSPLDIRTSHQIRPDVLLEGAGILAVDFFTRLGSRLRDDVHAGLLIGLATAVKFTGLLLVPFYLAARWLRPGPRLTGTLVAGLLSATMPLLLTPYALIRFDRYWSGPLDELRVYYEKAEGVDFDFAGHIAEYARAVLGTLGPIGAALALLGAVLLLRRSWRHWLPVLLLPTVVLVVMSTPKLVFPRLLLPGLGVVFLVAGFGVAVFATTRPRLAALVAVLAVATPARSALRYVNLVARPSPTDEALDWIETRLPEGARILETRPAGSAWAGTSGRGIGLALGVDPARHEIVYYEGDHSQLPRLAPLFDLVISDFESEGPWSRDLHEIASFRFRRAPRSWFPLGPPRLGAVALRMRTPLRKTMLTPIDLASARLSASTNQHALAALVDGNLSTAWRGQDPPRHDWVSLELPQPRRIDAIEAVVVWSAGRPPELVFEGAKGVEELEALSPVTRLRPTLHAQHHARRAGSERPFSSKVVLLDERPVQRLRVRLAAPGDGALALSQLRIFAATPGAAPGVGGASPSR